MKYDKVDTAFDRDKETFAVDETKVRRAEFLMVKSWLAMEKVNGTNIRVQYTKEGITFDGRESNSQLNANLYKFLQRQFLTKEGLEEMDKTFPYVLKPDPVQRGERERGPAVVTIFGEGYGAGIGHGGRYTKEGEVSFRIFDVNVAGIWLDWKDVQDVANKLGLKTVPVLQHNMTFDEVIENAKRGFYSFVSLAEGGEDTMPAEGIVAKTEPPLLNKKGERVMFKIKTIDWKKKGEQWIHPLEKNKTVEITHEVQKQA